MCQYIIWLVENGQEGCNLCRLLGHDHSCITHWNHKWSHSPPVSPASFSSGLSRVCRNVCSPCTGQSSPGHSLAPTCSRSSLGITLRQTLLISLVPSAIGTLPWNLEVRIVLHCGAPFPHHPSQFHPCYIPWTKTIRWIRDESPEWPWELWRSHDSCLRFPYLCLCSNSNNHEAKGSHQKEWHSIPTRCAHH